MTDGPGLCICNLTLQCGGMLYFYEDRQRPDCGDEGSEDDRAAYAVVQRPGDCITFSGEARVFPMHGVVKDLPVTELPRSATRAKAAFDGTPGWEDTVRVVITIRGGELPETQKQAWKKMWDPAYPKGFLDEKTQQAAEVQTTHTHTHTHTHTREHEHTRTQTHTQTSTHSHPIETTRAQRQNAQQQQRSRNCRARGARLRQHIILRSRKYRAQASRRRQQKIPPQEGPPAAERRRAGMAGGNAASWGNNGVRQQQHPLGLGNLHAGHQQLRARKFQQADQGQGIVNGPEGAAGYAAGAAPAPPRRPRHGGGRRRRGHNLLQECQVPRRHHPAPLQRHKGMGAVRVAQPCPISRP
jgi:hypothetical protein